MTATATAIRSRGAAPLPERQKEYRVLRRRVCRDPALYSREPPALRQPCQSLALAFLGQDGKLPRYGPGDWSPGEVPVVVGAAAQLVTVLMFHRDLLLALARRC